MVGNFVIADHFLNFVEVIILPNSITLTAKEMTKNLFGEMIYCYWDCYDCNNNFEFLHKDGEIYSADGHDKKIFNRLLEVFPAIKRHMKGADLGDWTWYFLEGGGGSIIVRKEIAQKYEETSRAQYGKISPNFALAKKFFDDLPLPEKNHIGVMEINHTIINSMTAVKNGWIYLGNEFERYVLGEPKQENLLIFGVNPSTATPKNPDATMTKILKIISKTAELKNCGYIMMNLNPQRTPKPEELEENAHRTANNLDVLDFVIKNFDIKKIWCAWGTSIDKKNFLKFSLDQIKTKLSDYNWIHYGDLTKKGHPRHPLYTPLNAKFSKFSMDNYPK